MFAIDSLPCSLVLLTYLDFTLKQSTALSHIMDTPKEYAKARPNIFTNHACRDHAFCRWSYSAFPSCTIMNAC
ncbi:hypothetical protein H744_2c0409 [Photobacterium gaetbulicola Gung47]|uniref:Uncharacterized protein n=1 Tax=Photobacterium gaetbulicola Gung47 TaxID=658445 RepID=A0A0C5WVL7_9GAMM|nr:hypothetical protein H744_2c0409 [Photobacterium gaetbulicola Gung47]